MNEIWVVVANNTRGRLFHYIPGHGLEEFEDLVNPEARLREQDLVSDSPGRGLNRPRASRFAMSPAAERKTHESDAFALSLARRLNAARREGLMKHLHVIAAPSFLGMLRSHLDASTCKSIRSEVAKNVSWVDPGRIRALLPQRL